MIHFLLFLGLIRGIVEATSISWYNTYNYSIISPNYLELTQITSIKYANNALYACGHKLLGSFIYKIDPSTGKIIWEYIEGTGNFDSITFTDMIINGDTIYLTGSFFGSVVDGNLYNDNVDDVQDSFVLAYKEILTEPYLEFRWSKQLGVSQISGTKDTYGTNIVFGDSSTLYFSGWTDGLEDIFEPMQMNDLCINSGARGGEYDAFVAKVFYTNDEAIVNVVKGCQFGDFTDNKAKKEALVFNNGYVWVASRSDTAGITITKFNSDFSYMGILALGIPFSNTDVYSMVATTGTSFYLYLIGQNQVAFNILGDPLIAKILAKSSENDDTFLYRSTSLGQNDIFPSSIYCDSSNNMVVIGSQDTDTTFIKSSKTGNTFTLVDNKWSLQWNDEIFGEALVHDIPMSIDKSTDRLFVAGYRQYDSNIVGIDKDFTGFIMSIHNPIEPNYTLIILGSMGGLILIGLTAGGMFFGYKKYNSYRLTQDQATRKTEDPSKFKFEMPYSKRKTGSQQSKSTKSSLESGKTTGSLEMKNRETDGNELARDLQLALESDRKTHTHEEKQAWAKFIRRLERKGKSLKRLEKKIKSTPELQIELTKMKLSSEEKEHVTKVFFSGNYPVLESPSDTMMSNTSR